MLKKVVSTLTLFAVCTCSTIPMNANALIFKKVDTFTIEPDGDEKSHDARMELNAETQTISIVDEKSGAAKYVYAEIPYGSITSASYSKSKHPRSGAGVALGIATLGVGLLVGFLAKNKKHWLTLTVTGVESLPNNYIYLKLDKGNFRQILSAVEASTGVDIEILEED